MLIESEAAVALTGAGISKASGIPTYRGPDDGVWRDSVAREWPTREAFDGDPAGWYERFWEFYNVRQGALPSAGHTALRDMVDTSLVDSVVTQNIDSLDRKAGTLPEKILEVHGNDRALSCTRVEECNFSIPTEKWLSGNDPSSLPTCPNDGEPLKPDIILFNDEAVPDHVARDWHRAWDVIDEADTLMVVGTTLAIATWAGAVADFAVKRKPLVVINPNPTPVDKMARSVIHRPAEEALPEIRDLALK